VVAHLERSGCVLEAALARAGYPHQRVTMALNDGPA
jgi:hypothetical protein